MTHPEAAGVCHGLFRSCLAAPFLDRDHAMEAQTKVRKGHRDRLGLRVEQPSQRHGPAQAHPDRVT